MYTFPFLSNILTQPSYQEIIISGYQQFIGYFLKVFSMHIK